MALTTEEKAALRAERTELIATANRHGLDLKPADFRVIDGGLTVDGMPPLEWIEMVSGVHEEIDADGNRVLVENEG
jgi:hypothetical protein